MSTGLQAQSIVAGTISGDVADDAGFALARVHITLTAAGTGVTQEFETGRSGQFEFGFLSPGTYELFAERLGERPVRVLGIAIGSGSRVRIPLELAPAVPPVTEVHTVVFGGGGGQATGPEGARRFADLELNRLPHSTRGIAELGRFSSSSNATLASEGLPGRFSGAVVDGVAYQTAGHPGLPQTTLTTAAFPLSAFDGLELLGGGVDVEYAGFAGPSLVGFTRRGSGEFEVRAFGDWNGDALASSDHFNPQDVSHTSVRGGFSASGPIVRDTAYFVLGAEVRRLDWPQPRVWEETAVDAQLVSIAADSFGTDLSSYLSPRNSGADIVSVFGRLDWQFGSRTSLMVRGNGSGIRGTNPSYGALRTPTVAGELDGTDVSGAATLTTAFSPALALELRVGAEFSSRDFSTTDIAHTVFADDPVAFGVDPIVPASFERFAVRASETLHIRTRRHSMKLGGGATVSSLRYASTIGRDGHFVFGGTDEFVALAGSFVQSNGTVPEASFAPVEIGGFFQDIWTPLPGLEVTGGLRVDVDLIPQDEVAHNEDWARLTGLLNADSANSVIKLSPRFGFVGKRDTWQVRGSFTVHHGAFDAASFSEVITQNGSGEVSRMFGALDTWPDMPSSATSSALTPSLAMLGPDYRPPRSSRASLGFSVSLGSFALLDLSGVYRHTDFLARRHDMNLVPTAITEDQYGRPLYGDLTQHGGALSADPGSNRRFDDFDVVSAFDADGYSDYWGFTARLERRVGDVVNLFAGYTRSQTEGNWLSGLGGYALQFTPFPEDLVDADWADGRSDFDQPHRFTLGATIELGALALSAFYRYESGLPFTPGFRYGVDANGDGSPRNDPAFVDNEVPGMADLVASWDCLRTQIGSFAERNSCRGPDVQTLDARLSISPVKIGKYPVALVIDGLNLLDADMADFDRAVYLVDRGGSLAVDPATGVVTVPLVANENFGEPIVRRGVGRAIRIGLRVNYE